MGRIYYKFTYLQNKGENSLLAILIRKTANLLIKLCVYVVLINLYM